MGYFIGPQVWAWRAGRVRVVKRLVQRMVVIFPFEEKIYREAGVPVDFVGHPLVDTVRPTMTRAEFAAQHGLDAEPADRHDPARQPPERDRAELRAHRRGLRAPRPDRAMSSSSTPSPMDSALSCSPATRSLGQKSTESKTLPTTRWLPPIARLSPAARPPWKPRCSARPWSSSTAWLRLRHRFCGT